MTLTLIVGALCLAVAGWKLRQKEQARAQADGLRGPSGRRADDDRTRAWDVAPRGRGNTRGRDDRGRDDRGGPPTRRALAPVPTGAIATAKRPGKAGKGGKAAEVQVNPGKCMRFGFCEHEAPAIFKLHGDGRLGYKTTAAPDQIDAVDRAVKICPARAIKMYRPGSSMYLPQNSPDLAEPRLDDGYEDYEDEYDEIDDLDDEFDDYEDDDRDDVRDNERADDRDDERADARADRRADDLADRRADDRYNDRVDDLADRRAEDRYNERVDDLAGRRAERAERGGRDRYDDDRRRPREREPVGGGRRRRND